MGHIGLFPGIVKNTLFEFPGNIAGIVKGPTYGDEGYAKFFGDVLLGDTHIFTISMKGRKHNIEAFPKLQFLGKQP
jgi:hypothetical protein